MTIKIYGCHFSDSMKHYTLLEMKEFLSQDDYEFVKAGISQYEYVYLGNFIERQKTYIHYNDQGEFKSMGYEGEM